MVTSAAEPMPTIDAEASQIGYHADIELVLPSSWELTLDAFLELADLNDWRIERTKQGHLLIMAPSGMESAVSSGVVFGELLNWAEEHGGLAIPPDAAIDLPDGSVLSPDACWLDHEQAARYWSLSKQERRRPGAFVPAFIVEVRSAAQTVAKQREKMIDQWMPNGVRLAWLIEPIAQDVYIYRPGQPEELLHRPATLSGEDVLEGFEMSCERLWR